MTETSPFDAACFTDKQLDAIEKIRKLQRLADNPSATYNEKTVAEARIKAIRERHRLDDMLGVGSPLPLIMPEGDDEAGRGFVLPFDAPPLSADQAAAIQKLLAAVRSGRKVLSLAGLAGTGKTTLVKVIVALFWHELGMEARYCAPTGKAASRLSDVTGVRATTVHKALRYSVEDDIDLKPIFYDPQAPVPPNTLLVVDEASMVDEMLHNDIVDHLPFGAAVLYLGDPRQLKPVNSPPGVDLRNPTAELTTIHRQALDSGIITAAHASLAGRHPARLPQNRDFVIRRADTWEDMANYTLDSVAQWFTSVRLQNSDPDYATLLTYTNETANELNRKVRALRGFAGIGPIIADGEVCVVRANAPKAKSKLHPDGLFNGETVVIYSVRRADATELEELVEGAYGMPMAPVYMVRLERGGDEYAVASDMMGKSQGEYRAFMKENVRKAQHDVWLHLSYGECLTAHLAQGSQWDEVGIVWDIAWSRLWGNKREEAISLFYTAATRAAKKVTLFKLDW